MDDWETFPLIVFLFLLGRARADVELSAVGSLNGGRGIAECMLPDFSVFRPRLMLLLITSGRELVELLSKLKL